MVGGTIINIVRLPDSTWVQCLDTTYSQDTCAIRLHENPDFPLRNGDKLWWQGPWAMFTPQPSMGIEDMKLTRIGYSHSSIPDDVMAVAL